MPSIELKRPVALNGKDYKRGVHDVSEDVAGHWMIQAMIADGDAVAPAPVVDAGPPPAAPVPAVVKAFPGRRPKAKE